MAEKKETRRPLPSPNQRTGLIFFAFLIIVTIFLAYTIISSDQEESQTNNQNAGNKNANVSIINNANDDKAINSSEPDNTNVSTNNNSDAGTNANVARGSVLSSSDYNFSVLLAPNEQAAETESEGIHTFHIGDQNKIIVLGADMEDFVKSDNGAITEQDITVDGQAGHRITGFDARDGSELDFILVVYNDRLYDFHGTEEFLDRVEQSFKFTE